MLPSQLPDHPTFVAVDVEASGLFPDEGARVSVVSVAWLDGDDLEAHAWPFGQGPPGQLFDAPEDTGPQEWEALLDWLAGRWWTAHNAKYDARLLAAGAVPGYPGRDLVDRLQWCSFVVEWLLSPLEPLSLAACAERYGLPPKMDVGSPKQFHLIPWAEIEPYAVRDAELHLLLCREQARRLAKASDTVKDLVDREIGMCRMLARMEARGVGFDWAGSMEAARQCEEQANAIELPFEFTPDGARRWFFGVKAAQPHCTSDGGKPSVGECCVRALAGQGVEGAAEYARKTKISNAASKWYRAYAEKVGPDGRLRTDFKQTGTISMRWSSTRVNLQALPHDYKLDGLDGVRTPRSLIIPRDGHELWELDFAQAELRVATSWADCAEMRRLIEEGEDAHGVTAERIFGGVTKERRQIAKRANFSFIFEIGPQRFRDDLEKQGVVLRLAEAKDIIDAWRKLYPEFTRANRQGESQVKRDGYVTLVNGRQRWFRDGEDWHKAFNQRVQGSVAVTVQDWMLTVEDLYPDILVLNIHDSMVVEVPALDAKAIVEQIQEIGQEMATERFGIQMVVDAKPW